MSPPVTAAIDVEVRYAETDQMGVVHHAEYVIWFELARTRLCARSGWTYAQIEKLGYWLMVTDVQLRYRRPARYGDTVRVSARVERHGSRGLTFVYEVTRDDELLVTGETRHIWIDSATGKPCRTPEPLRQPFAELAGEE